MPAERPLVKEDFEASRFTCNGGGLIEASVDSTDAIDGTGSSANPLDINPSTDANNSLVIGSDGKLYVPGFSETITTLVDNGNGTATYTNEAGAPVTIPLGFTQVVVNGDGSLTFTYPDGTVINTPTPAGNSAMAQQSTTGAGTREIRHTSGSGATFDFCEGFDSVRQNNACAVGVGTNKMVRSVSVSNKELIVDAASEHTFRTDGTTDLGVANIDISPLGNRQIAETPPLVLNNPSLCRDQLALVVGVSAVQIIAQTGGVWQLNVEQRLNGGAYGIFNSTQWGTFPGLIGIPWFMPGNDTQLVPAGGSLTIQRRMLINTVVASAPGSQALNFAVSFRVGRGTV